jgi:hypothetical protein
MDDDGKAMDKKTSEVLQGTLDLMILKTLHALGPQHGFGIARRIEQVSRDVLQRPETARRGNRELGAHLRRDWPRAAAGS